MGKRPAAEHAAGGVKKMGRRGEKETRSRGFLFILLIFVFFVCFVDRSSAQQIVPVVDREQIDWLGKAVSLSRSISHGSVEEKRNVLFEIRNLKSEKASRLAIPALRDGSEIVRATAASSVIFLPKTEAASVLLPLLNDKAEFVRREAAYALGEVGDSSATVPLLRIMARDKILEVRNAATIALGKIGDASAIDALTGILRNRPKEDDEFLRRAAARSIGQIAQIIGTGNRRVLTPQNFLPDKFKEIDSADDLTAQNPQFRAAADVLTRVLTSRSEADDTRREAAFALGAIGDESSVSVLRVSLNSADTYLAEIAEEALLKIRKRQ